MINCATNFEGDYVHDSTGQKCYQGVHIIHASFSIIITFIFVTIAIVVALNYFESRITSNDPTARSNSRADVCFIINKIVLQVIFAV